MGISSGPRRTAHGRTAGGSSSTGWRSSAAATTASGPSAPSSRHPTAATSGPIPTIPTACTRYWTASGCARDSRGEAYPGHLADPNGTASISNRLAVSAQYSIVSGDPEADRLELLAIAARNRGGPPERFERRFKKYYENNPLGPPSVFFARDNESEKLVGMTAVFPTTLRVAGQLLPAAIGGDFAVDAEHRGFGPAVALQRATIGVLSERNLRCAYGSPNRFSEPIVGRAGYADVGRFTRFVKLLTARPLVDRSPRRPRLARLASGAAGPVVSVISRERLYRRPERFSVDRPDRFDERFVRLWEHAREHQGATSERSAELLNWRYEKTGPAAGGDYSIFALREGTDVAGYVVHRRD